MPPTRDEILRQQKARLLELMKEKVRRELRPPTPAPMFPVSAQLDRAPQISPQTSPRRAKPPNHGFSKGGRPTKSQIEERGHRRQTLQSTVSDRLARLSLDGERPLLTMGDVLQGFTLTEISAMAGMDLGTLSRVLRGQTKPNFEMGLRLSLVLGIEPHDLCAFLMSQRGVYIRFGQRAARRGMARYPNE